jgi:hypothetical protein
MAAQATRSSCRELLGKLLDETVGQRIGDSQDLGEDLEGVVFLLSWLIPLD